MTDWGAALHDSPDGLVIDIEVVPNASTPGFPAGYNPWRKRIQARVAAAPEAGAANDELTRLIAERLSLPRDHVTIIDGHTSRRKRVLLRGLSIDRVPKALLEAPSGR